MGSSLTSDFIKRRRLFIKVEVKTQKYTKAENSLIREIIHRGTFGVADGQEVFCITGTYARLLFAPIFQQWGEEIVETEKPMQVKLTGLGFRE